MILRRICESKSGEFEKSKAFTRKSPALTISRIIGKLDAVKKRTHRAGLARAPRKGCLSHVSLPLSPSQAVYGVLTGQDRAAKAVARRLSRPKRQPNT